MSQLGLKIAAIDESVSPKGLKRLMTGEVTDLIRGMFRKVFLSAGSYAGEPWAPLSPYTVHRKLVMGWGYNHPLRATDAMFEALTDRGAQGGYAKWDGLHLEVGARGEEGERLALHQSGTPHMPARPVVPDASDIPEADIDSWCWAIARHIERAGA